MLRRRRQEDTSESEASAAELGAQTQHVSVHRASSAVDAGGATVNETVGLVEGEVVLIFTHANRIYKMFENFNFQVSTSIKMGNCAAYRIIFDNGRIHCSLLHAGEVTRPGNKSYHIRSPRKVDSARYECSFDCDTYPLDPNEIDPTDVMGCRVFQDINVPVPDTFPQLSQAQGTVILVRHGEGTHNTVATRQRASYHYSSALGKNPMLTKSGIEQAIRAGRVLEARVPELLNKVRFVACSDLLRAQVTARLAIESTPTGRKVLENIGRAMYVLPCLHEEGPGLENKTDKMESQEQKFIDFQSRLQTGADGVCALGPGDIGQDWHRPQSEREYTSEEFEQLNTFITGSFRSTGDGDVAGGGEVQLVYATDYTDSHNNTRRRPSRRDGRDHRGQPLNCSTFSWVLGKAFHEQGAREEIRAVDGEPRETGAGAGSAGPGSGSAGPLSAFGPSSSGSGSGSSFGSDPGPGVGGGKSKMKKYRKHKTRKHNKSKKKKSKTRRKMKQSNKRRRRRTASKGRK